MPVQTNVPNIAVTITNTAVNEGCPPRFCAMPMAIGVVTDLGPSEITTTFGAPSARAISIAETAVMMEPVVSETKMARKFSRIAGQLAYIGTARATVAGPSRK